MWRPPVVRPPAFYLTELPKKFVAVHNGKPIAELTLCHKFSSIRIRSKLNPFQSQLWYD